MVLGCSLARLFNGYQSCAFLDLIWRQFEISLRVYAFLDTFVQVRLSVTCVVILVDRSEVALASTEWRLGLALSSWTVPTPGLAAFSVSGPSLSDSDDELEANQG